MSSKEGRRTCRPTPNSSTAHALLNTMCAVGGSYDELGVQGPSHGSTNGRVKWRIELRPKSGSGRRTKDQVRKPTYPTWIQTVAAGVGSARTAGLDRKLLGRVPGSWRPRRRRSESNCILHCDQPRLPACWVALFHVPSMICAVEFCQVTLTHKRAETRCTRTGRRAGGPSSH